MLNPNTPVENPKITNISKIVLNLFNGFDILYIKAIPIVPVIMILIVEDISNGNDINFEIKFINSMLVITVNALGTDRLIKLCHRLSFTLSWLGSNASMKDGMPIVNKFKRVI